MSEVYNPTEDELVEACQTLADFEAATAKAGNRRGFPWPYWAARLEVALKALVDDVNTRAIAEEAREAMRTEFFVSDEAAQRIAARKSQEGGEPQ